MSDTPINDDGSVTIWKPGYKSIETVMTVSPEYTDPIFGKLKPHIKINKSPYWIMWFGKELPNVGDEVMVLYPVDDFAFAVPLETLIKFVD